MKHSYQVSNHGRFSKEGKNDEKKKYPIIGIYEKRNKRVYCYPARKNEKGQYLTKNQLKEFIEATCLPGSTIVSDEFVSYRFLGKEDSNYKHSSVDHSIRERVNEEGYTTNAIESFWSIVKKMYYSTHSNLPKQWMHLYCEEASFRYNFNDYRIAMSKLLQRSVITPLVIDIRKQGKFGDKTYDLSKYRMILPECFDDKDLKDITISDILFCEQPVYGILKEKYKPLVTRGGTKGKYPKEWQELGYIPFGVGYKDYRKVKKNDSVKEIQQMILEATKYKEANINVQPRKSDDYHQSPAQRRNYRLRKAYNELPPILQTQIKQEYPNLLKISAIEKTREIHGRMMSLRYWYKQNKDFLEVNA